MSTQSSRGVTRADVAKLAGVSVAVVSYTMNGGPQPVAPATAARVRDAVRKLGYRPNAAARALSLGRSEVLGLIIHDISNPHIGRLARAVETEAERRGLRVMIGSTLGDPSKTVDHVRELDARQVAGIILASPLDESATGQLQRISAPLVLLDTNAPTASRAQLQPDLRSGAFLALEHLFALGHDSVAFLGSPLGSEERHLAWQEAHRLSERTPGPAFEVDFTREGGYHAMQEMLATTVPTAVFASSDMVAVGALHAIREAGLRVPEDISVVSVDDSPEAKFAAPPLTTVHQPIEDMASDAVAALLDKAPKVTGRRVYPAPLIVRESTGPKRDSLPSKSETRADS
ncbi:LacI family DNA-binding transcriptional regulator [Microbacterium sp. zg-Y818]|uniref:LacI family DNA-binding transcriptional regulator n=1 Tax=unclassified Microbacterium TaxID=2609290 RepID=UPI00214C76C0|nr:MULTISPECIES: LacI family DNA-binding transcriptional regulator [unclassified Microbacterium]MCR2802025.1 LacI family transcriptional regulator [Microbacterium sp. zg.Y818]WIM22578.1 LacI family DNA-binding transcriptional regulator [Microbacterium sp. zg-Y818]